MASSRPTRVVIPSSKLGPENVGDMELSVHRKAIATAKSAPASTLPQPVVSSQSEPATHSDGDSSSAHCTPLPKSSHKRTAIVLSDDDTSDKDSPTQRRRAKKKTQKAKPKGMYYQRS
jgi:hypothetical protein